MFLKKNFIIAIPVLFSFIFLLSGCGSGKSDIASSTASAVPRGITGTIATGKTVDVDTIKIASNGGDFTVNSPGNLLDGLTLSVPAGSYTDTRNFEISYAPIAEHTFGDTLNPITPLITIDNGGGYSEDIMEITIPVQIPADHFAMGFLYDDDNEKLEGMALIEQSPNSITVGTRHFSDFFISIIPKIKLKQDIDTGFRPGIDDWQFTNRGSFIATGGHCAGQSMTAMWYYCTQPDGKDMTLYGRYDNNGSKPATPSFDYDDSLTYRFASVVQKDINWDSFQNTLWNNLGKVSEEYTWYAFAYAMQLTGEPQYVGIRSNAGGGHAMIVYRIYNGNLYISDPNYPGNTERRIEYANGHFTPYNSGANADEIAAGQGKAYEFIRYVGKTSMVNWNLVAQHWTEVKNKTIGNGVFPAYRIIWVDEKKNAVELKDGFVSPSKSLWIGAIEAPGVQLGSQITYKLFREGKGIDISKPTELNPGNNKIGFLVLGKVAGRDSNGNPTETLKYIDFQYINIVYNTTTVATQTDFSLPQCKYVGYSFVTEGEYQTTNFGVRTERFDVAGSPEIVWNGTAFSSPAPNNGWTVNGTVSPNGSEIIEMTVAYKGTGFTTEKSFKVAHVPIAQEEGSLAYSFRCNAIEMEKYFISASHHIDMGKGDVSSLLSLKFNYSPDKYPDYGLHVRFTLR